MRPTGLFNWPHAPCRSKKMLASPGRYGFGELDTVVPAYAATVHKSQGSEYPVVVIPVLTQHYAMLRRNLLYTGVKRGKRLVELVGQKKAVAIAVRNVSGRRRWSKLDERLSGPAADRASDSTGGVGSSTGGTRNASCMRSESGSASSIWPCIRTRPGSSSSDGTPRRTAERGGRAARRRSTFWASRTTAGRPGAGGSGSGASPLRSR